MAKRFYQIAFELGVHPRRLIGELTTLGLSVGNQMVVVAAPLEARIRALYDVVRPTHKQEPAATRRDEAAAGADRANERRGGVAVADGEAEPSVDAADATAEEPQVQESETAAGELEEVVEETSSVETPAAAEPATAERSTEPDVGTSTPKIAPTAHPTTHAPSAGAPTVSSGTSGSHAPPAHPPRPKLKLDPAKLGYKNLPTSARVAPKSAEPTSLIPTIDPRAGRLVKEAPKQGIPGVTRTPQRPGGPAAAAAGGALNPSLTKPAPAPGARRDSRTRGAGAPAESGERHGKQTFQLRSRRRGPVKPAEAVDTAPKTFEVTPPLALKQFSEISGIKVSDVVKTMLLKHKQVLTPNSMLDESTLTMLGLEFDRDIRFVKLVTREDAMVTEAEKESKPEDLKHRPPVVVVMGHVDHGKTSLLDFIRKADVAAHEAGGITQHIGAYQVTLADGKKITFFDTPGHEAFTEMRRRGAKVTDIVVLVVAADDGVMPQTIEAIDHAKAANVPIAVALTKSDKVGFKDAALDRVKQQLTQHGILVSGWGGEIECYPVAAVGKEAGRGIDKLLEHIVLLAEVEDLRADPNRPATGAVIEAENNPGRGVLATLLVEQGTLRRGDPVVTGRVWGRVRAMRDDKGQTVDEAPPGTPVEVTGLDEVPEVGKGFFVRPDVNEAREIAEQRRTRDRELELAAQAKPASVENLFSAIEQGKTKTLKVVLKTDVQGSLEAIKARLDAVGNTEVRVNVIRAGVGAVSESDVTLAAAYGALILGFHVVADETARGKAKHLGVDIRMYRIIYELEEEIRAILEGKLAPEKRESILGHAEILQVIRSGKFGNIAGSRVRDGTIRRDSKARLSRDGVVVWEGAIASLRHFKDDVKEVKEGFECGIRLESFDDLKEGDLIEAYTVESVARTLGA